MNSQQTQKPNSDQSPSFDDVSKLFSLPLSEAADILGVSSSVLKKICTDNGLERWPHRKYLSGKSIEEIKKEASREKNRANIATSNIDKQGNNNLPLSGAQVKDKTFISKSNLQQQPGSRSVFSLRPHQEFYTPNFANESLSGPDEFKYGFPSDGLSASSYKWWGESGNPVSDHDESEAEIESKSTMNDDEDDVEIPECSHGSDHQMGALSAIRKRALEEGRETLKFGFWKEFGAEKVGKKEKLILTRIFG